MYNRINGSNFTIVNDEEKKFVIKSINDKLLKHNIFKCIGLDINKIDVLKSAICTDIRGSSRVFKIIGQFPILKLQDIDGQVIGDVEFATPKQFVISADVNKVMPKIEIKKEKLTKEKEKSITVVDDEEKDNVVVSELKTNPEHISIEDAIKLTDSDGVIEPSKTEVVQEITPAENLIEKPQKKKKRKLQ